MPRLKPAQIADLATRPVARVRCPECDGPIVLETVPGTAHRRRVICTCGWCTRINETWEIDQAGDATYIPPAPPRPAIPRDLREFNRPTCRVPGCRARAAEYGLCDGHLIEWKVAGRPTTAQVWATQQSPPRKATDMATAKTNFTCVVPGCGARAFGRRLCTRHYFRWRKAGKPDVDAWSTTPDATAPPKSTTRAAPAAAAPPTQAPAGVTKHPNPYAGAKAPKPPAEPGTGPTPRRPRTLTATPATTPAVAPMPLHDKYRAIVRRCRELEEQVQHLRKNLGDRHDSTIDYLVESAAAFLQAATTLAEIRVHNKPSPTPEAAAAAAG